MSCSGFLCPECRIDLGSVDGLTRHFNEIHQKNNQPTKLFKKLFKTDSDIPSQQGKIERHKFPSNRKIILKNTF